MPHDDDDGEIAAFQGVRVVASQQIVVRVSRRLLESLGRRRVEHQAVIARKLVQPVVLRVPAGPPAAIVALLGLRRRGPCSEYGTERRGAGT